MTVQTNYYELLGVGRDADGAAIKSAYRRMAKEYHPDRNGGCKDNEAKFKAVSEAYECLKDPQKRAAYDRFGHEAYQQGASGGNPFGGGQGAQDFSDIFSSIFGDFMNEAAARGGGRGQPAAGRGSDLRYDMELTLEEAFAGTEKTITIEALAPCEPCEGNGAKGESKPETCRSCGGAGRVRAQQGFFLVERTCQQCLGTGLSIADPCPVCEGDGRALKKRKVSVDIPAGVDEGTRIRVAGEGEAGLSPRDLSREWRYLYPASPKPGYSEMKAYFNMDNGSGKLRGIHAEGNVGAEKLLRSWLSPFGDLGASQVVAGNTGGTDHVFFQAIGLPAFQFVQDPLDYFARLHHTNADTFDHLRPDDLRQASTVMAGVLLAAANDKDALPREPIPQAPQDSDPFDYKYPDE